MNGNGRFVLDGSWLLCSECFLDGDGLCDGFGGLGCFKTGCLGLELFLRGFDGNDGDGESELFGGRCLFCGGE